MEPNNERYGDAADSGSNRSEDVANNSRSTRRREGFIVDTSIDGENCEINSHDLQAEKMRIDEKYQQVMEELERERMAEIQSYEDKANQLHENDHYKEEIYEEKIKQLMEEKAQQDMVYEEKIKKLKGEMETALTSIKEKVDQLNKERDVQLQIIEDNMEEVRQEKSKYDELYKIQLDKIRQDSVYKQELERVKRERVENQELHQTRQEQLRKEKEFRESDLARSIERERNAALIKLQELEGYAVADEDPDVRGWRVIGKNGSEVGRIDDLIVDREAMKVRYLDIDLNENFLTDGRDSHLLLPIGVAEIDIDEDQVYIPTIDRAIISKIPAYNGNQVTRDYETTLLNILSPDNDRMANHEDGQFYNREHFNQDRFYRPRRNNR